MTPLGRIVKRLAEGVAGTWYEGPEPPARLDALVVEFANQNPNATRQQWGDFARRLAAIAYRAGFQRGFEHVEREVEPGFQRLPPDLVADREDPDWRWSPPCGPDMSNPHEAPEDPERGNEDA